MKPRKILSLLLTLALVLGVFVGTPLTARAAGTTYDIDGVSGRTWDNFAPTGTFPLQDGDILNIGAGAGSPSIPTTIMSTPAPDFHRLDIRHARHTVKRG